MMLLMCFVVVPILSGVMIYTIPKIPIKTCIVLVELALLALFLLSLYDIVENGQMKNVLGAEVDVMGIVLIADRLNIIYVGLSVMLFSACFIYTMKESFFDKKFAMLFFILQGLLSGVFLTDDLFNIYVLLEVATVVVAILIMFKKDSRSMYDGMVYLLSQVICMVFYLFGIGYLYKIFGVLSITKIKELMPHADPQSLLLPFAFIMTAVCLKSAFFPLFSWLPRAHGTPSAPSSVSAILSGLYVKNGIFMFYVFTNLFYGMVDYHLFFIIIGAITAVLGIAFAVAQTDIKLILAYSTVSQIGLIAIALSVDNEISNYGGLYHIICHAIFKALLFLSAGMIIKRYKTRDIREISGVFKTMPVTSTITIIGILGITGAPFINGSISKYFIQSGVHGTWIEYLIIAINVGTVLVFTKYSYVFLGKGSEVEGGVLLKRMVIFFLGLACIAGGVFGTQIMQFVFNASLSINTGQYIQKSVIYVLSLVASYFIFKYLIKGNAVFEKFGRISFNFQQIIMAMVAFFVTVNLALLIV